MNKEKTHNEQVDQEQSSAPVAVADIRGEGDVGPEIQWDDNEDNQRLDEESCRKR